MRTAFLCLSALAVSASAKLYTDPSQLPKTEYDFVIVGAGTAGNAVARRLADSAFKVLVLEAGINNDNPSLPIPFLGATLLANTSLYWEYLTVPQRGLNSRVLQAQTGRLLGGTSSVNFQIYNHGSKDDWDRIANVTGDIGWSWNNILPFLKKSENFTQPQDGHNITGEFDPRFHGFNGPVRTTLPNFPSDTDSRVIQTTKIDPEQFPFDVDPNDGDTIGFSWTQTTTGGGERSSSATAYLQPVIDLPNLDVIINAQVTRLINIATTAGKTVQPDLRGVEFARDANSQKFTVRATKEVIVSAGALKTPHLLLLSGIGDKKALAKFGIPVLVDSPGVGQNYQDHPLLAAQWLVNSNNTFDDISRNATLAAQLRKQWTDTRTGIFSMVPVNQIAWLRLPQSFFKTQQDPTAGPTSSHIELLPANRFVSFKDPNPPTGSFFSILHNVVQPVSRGSVTLNSSNPFDLPNVDPAYLSDPFDMQVMVQAFKLSQSFISTSPWNGFIVSPSGALANVTNDDELVEWIKNSVTTFWHPAASARMGKASDPNAVVDPKLLLKGVNGVRVVDASVFPYIPAAHPQGAIYGVAERAASLILEKWK